MAKLALIDPFETPETLPSTTPPPPDIALPEVTDHDEDTTSVYRSPNDAYSYSPPRPQLPRRSYLPLPPSPLGLSNYDILDVEDDYDSYAHFETHGESDMDDPRCPANTSTSMTSILSTAGTGVNDAPKKLSRMLFCGSNLLDSDEPVVGNDDGVDEGIDGIWPNLSIKHGSLGSLLPASSSPNFSAPCDTATEATRPSSPNFATTLLAESIRGRSTGLRSGRGGVFNEEVECDFVQEGDRQRSFMS
ncbi:hypothetical protein K504DRAFT_414072 [Pleomassaria siparia CBS 279.74]|uniref:Uncharacterized protein n=1 Tax=Pleomassaria siparia CBS 279.74 TaxID=1314801 RepID=A0A6G1JZE7_9PLEO|nr:hypothetical protein K504DRAFT_414072 [Pleomassaria siparia CBS 279.74]